MLEIVRYGEDEYDFPCLLVLGCFDGLHAGHAELLKKAKLQAKINGLDLGVMMFADGKGGKQLYSFEERTALLEQYNVKFVLKVNFDEEFKKIKPLEFLECLEDKLNLKAYMSGKDFRFGQGKKGKSSTLKSYADDEENSVWYMSVKEVMYEGEKISTTKIKELLDAGDVKLAAELLGRNYSVTGNVIHGADRGGKVVGYPTMNVDFSADKYPVKEGVYQVKATLGESVYDGIANYGARPTFGEDNPVLEVYLEGLEGDHYGEEVKVEFITYLRDIQKFDGAEELSEQLSKDISCIDGEKELAVTDTEDKPAEQEPIEETEEVATVAEEPLEHYVAEVTEVAEEEVEETSETQVETAEEITEEAVEEVPQEEQFAVSEIASDEAFEEELEETTEECVEEVVEETTCESAEELLTVEAVEEENTEVIEEEVEETSETQVETAEELTEETVEEPEEDLSPEEKIFADEVSEEETNDETAYENAEEVGENND